MLEDRSMQPLHWPRLEALNIEHKSQYRGIYN